MTLNYDKLTRTATISFTPAEDELVAWILFNNGPNMLNDLIGDFLISRQRQRDATVSDAVHRQLKIVDPNVKDQIMKLLSLDKIVGL